MMNEQYDPNLDVYVPCTCGSEVLRVFYNEEWDEFEVSIYELPQDMTWRSWKYKLRQIWRILKHGRPYGDQVVPSRDSMRNLQIMLNGVLEQKD